MIRRIIELALIGILVLLVFSLALGYVLGQPVLISYVTSDSMEPTLNEGDGFIAIPAAISGEISEGDVVVFESAHIHGGELTTHRVRGTTGNGYITQGDNNFVTDQSAGAPPITDGQIKAVALQINGEVVRLPRLGTGIDAVSGAINQLDRTISNVFGLEQLGETALAYVLFAIGILLFVASYGVDRFGRRLSRDISRSRLRQGIFSTWTIIGVFVLLIMFSATLAMLMPAGTETIDIVSSEQDSDRPDVIQQGTSSEFNMSFANGGFIPTISYFEPASEGVEVQTKQAYLRQGEHTNVTLVLHAPPETGLFPRSMTEYRYLAILPPAVIDRLYSVHPWLPYIAINGMVGSIILIIGFVLSSGGEPLRTRTRKRTGARSWFG